MKKNNNINSEEFRKKYPELSSVPKKNPFSTPDAFFETLPQSINKRIHQTKKPSFISVLFPAPVRVAFSAIAVIAVLFIGFMWFYKAETNNLIYNDYYVEEYLIGYFEYNPVEFYEVIYEEEFPDEQYQNDDYDEELFEYIVNYANYYMMIPEDFNGD